MLAPFISVTLIGLICSAKGEDIKGEVGKKFKELDKDIPEAIKKDVLTALDRWVVSI